MSSHLSLKDYEQFSAYLDGQLSPAETRKLEEQLKANPEWRLALDELAATRTVVRRAPRYRAPRNFTLTPEMAHQVARKPVLPSLFSFRFSAALAAMALIAVLVLQVLPGSEPAIRVSMAPTRELAASLNAEEQPSGALKAAPQESIQATAQNTPPPVVVWNNQSNMTVTGGGPMAFGKGGGGGGGDGSTGPERGIVTYKQSSSGAFMAGGAGEGAGSFAPQGQAGGIVTYSGEPAPASSAPVSPPVQDQALAPAEALPSSSPLEGSGPILGVPSAQEAGKIIATSPVMPASASQPGAVPASASGEAFTVRRWVQVALLGVALLAGVYTWFARRRV